MLYTPSRAEWRWVSLGQGNSMERHEWWGALRMSISTWTESLCGMRPWSRVLAPCLPFYLDWDAIALSLFWIRMPEGARRVCVHAWTSVGATPGSVFRTVLHAPCRVTLSYVGLRRGC